jgi:hypothetical protein
MDNINEIDWSKIDLEAKVDPEELARLDSLSGKKCPCGKETTIGEDEAWGFAMDVTNGDKLGESNE